MRDHPPRRYIYEARFHAPAQNLYIHGTILEICKNNEGDSLHLTDVSVFAGQK